MESIFCYHFICLDPCSWNDERDTFLIYTNILECYSLEKPEEAVVKFEPAENPVEDSFAESKPADDAGKLARRRPVRRASKKILHDANPELVRHSNDGGDGIHDTLGPWQAFIVLDKINVPTF